MARGGPLVDAGSPAPALLRAGPRRWALHRRLLRERPLVRAKSMSGYVELHAHSAYSFGDGASLPDELALAAAELGHEAIAITDHDGVWGAMELAQSCSALGVRPIAGTELSVSTPAAPGREAEEAAG